MTRKRYAIGSSRHNEPAREDDPFVKIGVLRITGSRIGGVLALGLGVYLWIALPPFRLFVVGVIVLGVVIGLLLWWKHRRGQ